MNGICIRGIGAVSPAGWGIPALREALAAGQTLPATKLERPGWNQHLLARTVPQPTTKLPFYAHPRHRRASSISHFATAAALEALDQTAPSASWAGRRLGIVFCSMCGGVRYSRRFYAEILQDPATASPLLFPETVFNAPASHLAAVLGVTAINYTLIGDSTVVLEGLALAAQWLVDDRVEDCLVVAAEELDWPVADAWRIFSRNTIVAEGAGALCLSRQAGSPALASLDCVTSPALYTAHRTVQDAGRAVRAQLPPPLPGELLCCSRLGWPGTDAAVDSIWQDWTGPRLAPKVILGEGIAAGTAWQCVAALDALQQRHLPATTVTVLGCNQQAIAARFLHPNP